MLFTRKEVANQLRIDDETVRRWLSSGVLKGLKVGNSWRVREDDLQEFLKDCEVVNKEESNKR